MEMPFGEARAATEDELRAGVREPGEQGGVYLGRHYDADEDEARSEILYQRDRHVLFFGPTGSGKGVRFLIPNLLKLNDRSIIVVDPKAELAAMTAKYRHEQGDDVKILDPFGVLEKIVSARPDRYAYLIDNGLVRSMGFNPLAVLDPQSPLFYDDAAGIGEALIKVEGSEPHWSESAQGLVVGLIMWEKKRNGAKANLENVREMLTEADEYEDAIGEDGKPDRRLVRGLRHTARLMCASGGYEIDSLAARFQQLNDEILSVRSTADTQTRWLLSPPMRANLKVEKGIDFGQLKERPTAVYVVLPAERMRTHSVWLRLVIVSALRALYRPGGRRTLVLIDELAALGHLAPLEDAFGLVRGYNVQIAAILQDLGQLKALYKERWETFIANAGVVQGFAPNDLTTADWMSKRSGQKTVVAKGVSENTGQSASERGATTTAGRGASDQQVGRALFLPHELIGFEEGMGLLWLAGMDNAARFFAPIFTEITECEGRYLPSPYYRAG